MKFRTAKADSSRNKTNMEKLLAKSIINMLNICKESTQNEPSNVLKDRLQDKSEIIQDDMSGLKAGPSISPSV